MLSVLLEWFLDLHWLLIILISCHVIVVTNLFWIPEICQSTRRKCMIARFVSWTDRLTLTTRSRGIVLGKLQRTLKWICGIIRNCGLKLHLVINHQGDFVITSLSTLVYWHIMSGLRANLAGSLAEWAISMECLS